VVRRTAAARPGVAGGPRRGIPEGPLGRPDEGRGSRPRGPAGTDALPHAAHGGRAAAGHVRRHGEARARLGTVPGTGPCAARALRRAVADPGPAADRRGPSGAVASGGRAAGVRRGGTRRRRPSPAPHDLPATPVRSRPRPPAVPPSRRNGAESRTGPPRPPGHPPRPASRAARRPGLGGGDGTGGLTRPAHRGPGAAARCGGASAHGSGGPPASCPRAR
jgi:hypothetical protein